MLEKKNEKEIPAPLIETTRVVIVGAGFVGSTAAYTLMIQGIASEIVLVDVNKDKCLGEAMDLGHGLSFVKQSRIWAGDYSDCKDADVVVITAGLGQKVGQTRLDLAAINAKIIGGIIEQVRHYTDKAVILMVTNPLDVMTYVALKKSGLPNYQVFGTGTTLDSSRFRYLLAQEFGVAPDSMAAYLIGEHGDSEVPIISHANLMGENITSFKEYDPQLVEDSYNHTKNAAYEIICKKGATYYAIALAISRIVRAILYDENHVFPLSSLLTGQYGLKDICLSLPSVVGRTGIKRVLEVKLNDEELQKLRQSAKVISETIKSIKI
ncbi:MAG: L-lactate dehydrogenase [Candidatus Magasanikbacteria bacterium RIFOXYB2_FULL_38_10]|nr:MAG: L-lactate dehydrogenase [Candidatus Magasanikbacteria bacterium RIFOXYB2_FULL_38_10]